MSSNSKTFIGAVEDQWQLYSDDPEDYALGAPVGFGASSIVYAAEYTPKSSGSSSKPIPVALKVLDLDRLPPHSLSLLQRETTLMSLSKHPNVLRVRGSWMEGHKLYIALRLMSHGSAADVMRYGWSGGMDESVIKCILEQALQGLNYLHINGFIHRDVKAANLLIDDDGTVLVGDLGVAADLSEDVSDNQTKPQQTRSSAAIISLAQSTDASSSQSATDKRTNVKDSKPRMGKRKSFVGTPCWMAPELIQGRQYDSSADIWSFGITALELTQGRPPRSREAPQKVLLKTVQGEPPTLDREGGVFKYSKAFKEIIDSCLTKDPSKRPTAEQLLQSSFFKSAKKKLLLVNTVLRDLPPLSARQERRALSSILSGRSVDSWDFATTVAVKHLHEDLEQHFIQHGIRGAGEPSGSSVSDGEDRFARVPSTPHDIEEQDRESQISDSERLLGSSPDCAATQLSKAASSEQATPMASKSSSDEHAASSSPDIGADDSRPTGWDIKRSSISHELDAPAQQHLEKDGYPSSAPSQSVLEQAYSLGHLRRTSSSTTPLDEKKRSGQSRLWRKLTGRGASKVTGSELKESETGSRINALIYRQTPANVKP